MIRNTSRAAQKVGKNEWSRETLNRWINGKCPPKSLTSAEEALRKMLPEAPAHHPDYASGLLTCLPELAV